MKETKRKRYEQDKYYCCFVGLCGGSKEDHEMAFLQVIKYVPPPHAVGDALGCLCLRRAAADGGETESDGHRLEEENTRTAVKEWFEEIFFEIILSTVHVVRANDSLHLFTTELQWTQYLCYVNGFFRESEMRRRVLDQGNF